MKRINITRAAAVASCAGLLGFASLAIAADQKPAAKPAAPAYTDLSKLPKFEHVRVVHATPEQRAASNAKAPPMVAQKAYLDSSGNLRPITAEDLVNEAAAAKAAPASSSAGSAPVALTASGGHVALLDESSNVYSVARIGANGKVEQVCVDGQPNGEAALKAAAAKAKQEHSHEK
jgi:hypothetical protein